MPSGGRPGPPPSIPRRAMLHIGILQFQVEIAYAQSLKDKRAVIKSLKDRLRRSFNVSIAEIDDLDVVTEGTLINALNEWRDGVLVDHQLEIISPR